MEEINIIIHKQKCIKKQQQYTNSYMHTRNNAIKLVAICKLLQLDGDADQLRLHILSSSGKIRAVQLYRPYQLPLLVKPPVPIIRK